MTTNTIKFDISTIDSNDVETKLCSTKGLQLGLGIILVGRSKLLSHLGIYSIRKVNARNSRFQQLTINSMKMYSLPNSQQMMKQGDLCVTDHSCNNLDTFHVLAITGKDPIKVMFLQYGGCYLGHSTSLLVLIDTITWCK